jgi:hypothetical protein
MFRARPRCCAGQARDFLFDLRKAIPMRVRFLAAARAAAQREQAGLCAIHFSKNHFRIRISSSWFRHYSGIAAAKHSRRAERSAHNDIIQLGNAPAGPARRSNSPATWRQSACVFERGRVRHATARARRTRGVQGNRDVERRDDPSEVHEDGPTPRTINLDWQMVMNAVRESDERQTAATSARFNPRNLPRAKCS